MWQLLRKSHFFKLGKLRYQEKTTLNFMTFLDLSWLCWWDKDGIFSRCTWMGSTHQAFPVTFTSSRRRDMNCAACWRSWHWSLIGWGRLKRTNRSPLTGSLPPVYLTDFYSGFSSSSYWSALAQYCCRCRAYLWKKEASNSLLLSFLWNTRASSRPSFVTDTQLSLIFYINIFCTLNNLKLSPPVTCRLNSSHGC